MNSSSSMTAYDPAERWIIVGLSSALALAVLAYALPEIVAALSKSPMMYVNAWDEETYLTLQGAEAVKNRPGYFVMYLVKLLIEQGFAGAWINFVADLVLVPFVVFLIFKAVRLLGYGAAVSMFGAFVVPFSSVLINRANPIIEASFDIDQQSWLVTGFETYASILRTPNPQVSYVLIALAVWAYARYRRSLILLAVMPFLYPFVLLPYAYLTGFLILASSKFKERWSVSEWRWWLLCHGLLTAALLLAYFGFSRLYLTTDVGGYQFAKGLIFERRLPAVPIGALALGVMLLLVSSYSAKSARQIASLMVCSLIIANMHLVSGLSLQQKNLHDYGTSMLFGCGLFLLFDAILNQFRSRTKARFLLNAGALLVSISTLAILAQSSGFSFSDLRYRILVGRQFAAANDRAFVKEYPLNALIADTNFSSKMAYSGVSRLSPILSYQYFFGARRVCHDYERRFNSAITSSALQTGLEKPDQQSIKRFENSMEEYLLIKPSSLPKTNYCADYQESPDGWRIIPTKGENFIYFPAN